jgi:hypothetical protein
MTKSEELERTIDSLPDEEYRRFRRWFMEKDWERWDRQIAEGSRACELDFLAKEAVDAKKASRARPKQMIDTSSGRLPRYAKYIAKGCPREHFTK